MTTCKDCCIPMKEVMSFSKKKHERFCRCPNCRRETRHIPIKDSELNFEEVLNRVIHKK